MSLVRQLFSDQTRMWNGLIYHISFKAAIMLHSSKSSDHESSLRMDWAELWISLILGCQWQDPHHACHLLCEHEILTGRLVLRYTVSLSFWKEQENLKEWTALQGLLLYYKQLQNFSSLCCQRTYPLSMIHCVSGAIVQYTLRADSSYRWGLQIIPYCIIHWKSLQLAEVICIS